MLAIYLSPFGCIHATSFPEPGDVFIRRVADHEDVWALMDHYKTIYEQPKPGVESEGSDSLNEDDFSFDF